jgi:serine phosphatase RsbU (regulator of sigma subunit)/predicted enzyme related to lactoylglutathione lyase
MSHADDPNCPPVDAASRPRRAQPPHLRVHAIMVLVADQDRSLRFFVDRCGFRLLSDTRIEGGDERWIAVGPPDGTAVLSLVRREPQGEMPAAAAVATTIFVTDDIQAQFEIWCGRGVPFRHPPIASRWGAYTVFEDPDGNAFMLVSVDPLTRALETEQRAAAAREEADRRAAQELAIATQVQARLFPQRQPPVRTLDYAGRCVQARQVGGDYYDFLELDGDRLGLLVGDISGKGIGAALLMANLQANVRSQSAGAADRPLALLRSVNDLFVANTPDSAYATLFFAVYDDRTQRLHYANCGHPPPLLVRGDGDVERLTATGTVIGLFEDWECALAERQLQPGDLLAIYTDGVSEAIDARDEEFGEGRLREALLRVRHRPAADVLAAVLEAVQHFSGPRQFDDITLMVARCREADAL